MDFKEATDALCGGVTHAELAKAMGVLLPTVRQARLDTADEAHRNHRQTGNKRFLLWPNVELNYWNF